jgi:hypothetical protein
MSFGIDFSGSYTINEIGELGAFAWKRDGAVRVDVSLARQFGSPERYKFVRAEFEPDRDDCRHLQGGSISVILRRRRQPRPE